MFITVNTVLTIPTITTVTTVTNVSHVVTWYSRKGPFCLTDRLTEEQVRSNDPLYSRERRKNSYWRV